MEYQEGQIKSPCDNLSDEELKARRTAWHKKLMNN